MSRRARVLAWIALLASALLLVLVVVFVVHNGLSVALGLIGLGAAVTGAWWVVTGRTLRRVLGVAFVLVGLALQVVALVHAGDGGWGSAVRLARIAGAAGGGGRRGSGRAGHLALGLDAGAGAPPLAAGAPGPAL